MSKIEISVTSDVKRIQVGHQSENDATQVIFDISSWVEEYGEGTCLVKVLRPTDIDNDNDEVPYNVTIPVSTEDDTTVATWSLSSLDTYNKGKGKVQLVYTVNDTVVKTLVYKYIVGESIATPDSPVDPFDEWIERSKAWAIGKLLDGEDVPSTDETYHDNSKYWKEQTNTIGTQHVQDAEAWAKGTKNGTDVPSSASQYHNNSKYWSEQAHDLGAAQVALATEQANYARAFNGAPRTAATAAAMTDTTKIYVYTGSETGYTSGNWYYHNGTAWTSGGVYNSTAFTTDTTLSLAGRAADAEAVGDLKADLSDIAGLNLFTLANASVGKYITDNGTFESNLNSTATDFIPINPSDDYSIKFNSANTTAFTFRLHEYGSDKSWLRMKIKRYMDASDSPTIYSNTITTSADAHYVRISYRTDQFSDCIFVNNIMGLPTAYDYYVRNYMKFAPERMTFFAPQSKNLINPANINGNVRPTVTSVSLIERVGNYSGSGFIEVEDGETYIVSGTAFDVYQGIYFGENARYVSGQSGISTITFFDAVDGSGKCFTVPENQGIKYVAVNLKDTGVLVDGKYPINGTYQMELGEVATTIVPYDNSLFIKPQYIKDSGGGGGGDSDINPIEMLPRPQYETSKISNFKSHWLKKDKDLMVCGTGTSLTARAVEHCTMRTDAKYRPPLMDANNLISYIWNALAWDGQQYRRYDADGFFTETGSFQTASQHADWDEGSYRAGLTRYAEGSASVAFTVPSDAWQFNFIYRTDGEGSEACTISISEGNNKMEVFNGSAWVEANGYSFSERETPVILPSVTVPKPNSITTPRETATITNYQVGGNTTYQKRLKMRCKSGAINSIGSTKTVTISSASGRFMYWGVEWSPRQYMITYVNSSRGSHNITYNSQYALMHYQDNDIWSFKPDLIFTENPIHNSGAGAAPSATYHTSYWGNITYDFFFNEDNPISLVSRAVANGLDVDDIEWVIFNTSVCWNFGTIDANGQLKIALNADGFAMSSMDEQMYSNLALVAEDKALVINAIKYWVDSAIKMFGNLRTATTGSGKSGATFTDEGSHWNDTGSKIMARCVGGVFNFYN